MRLLLLPCLLLPACAGFVTPSDPPAGPAPFSAGESWDSPAPPIEGARLPFGVHWESTCYEAITDADVPCDEQTYTLAVRCDGVPCDVDNAGGTFTGDAYPDVWPHAPGTMTVHVTATRVDDGDVRQATLGPVEIRPLDAITFDCFLADGARCGDTVPAGSDVAVFVIGHSGDDDFPLDQPWQSWLMSPPPTRCDDYARAEDFYPPDQPPLQTLMPMCRWDALAPGELDVTINHDEQAATLTLPVQG
jgi:hypothetical protein